MEPTTTFEPTTSTTSTTSTTEEPTTSTTEEPTTSTTEEPTTSTTEEPTTSTTSTTEEPTTSTTTTPCPPDPDTGIRPTNGMVTILKDSQGRNTYYLVVQCIRILVKLNIQKLLEDLRLALIALQEARNYKAKLVQQNDRFVSSIRTAPERPSGGQISRQTLMVQRDTNLDLIVTAQAGIDSLETNISNLQSAIGQAFYADWTPEMKQKFRDDTTKTYKQNLDINLEGTIFRTIEPKIPAYFIPGPKQFEDR